LLDEGQEQVASPQAPAWVFIRERRITMRPFPGVGKFYRRAAPGSPEQLNFPRVLEANGIDIHKAVSTL
jgi:hypothetical protein